MSLTITGKSTARSEVWNMLTSLIQLGFEKVQEIKFIHPNWYDGKVPPQETLYIFFNRHNGLLMKFETYNTTEINSGKVYFNLVYNKWSDIRHLGYSGGHSRAFSHVLRGNIEVRSANALEGTIENLNKAGRLLVHWVEPDYIQFCHYGDYAEGEQKAAELGLDSEYDYYTIINDERFWALPNWVLDQITERDSSRVIKAVNNQWATLKSYIFRWQSAWKLWYWWTDRSPWAMRRKRIYKEKYERGEI